jgi:hypothetical protein
VTLNGEIIEVSGTMNGGGRPKSGKMPFLKKDEDVEMKDSKNMNSFYTK